MTFIKGVYRIENPRTIQSLIIYLIIPSIWGCNSSEHKPLDYPVQPIPFSQVEITGGFWHKRLKTNREVTIPFDFRKCEETCRISNFAKAGGLEEGEHEGRYYNDSDVFKVIEGASYSLTQFPDPELETYLDNLIEKIAAAQEEDGYLYTNRTINPDNAADSAGNERWTHLAHYHELYNVGHMYEAAVAHYRATGKRNLLNIAIKNADLVVDTFGPGKNRGVPGHQEIEIGLVKLYRVTGNKKYLDLARFFLDERGNPAGHELYGKYSQDHKPVREQSEAVGHAVRAGYMYAGMVDVAALTGDTSYLAAIDKIWENIVSGKLYITGGIGSSRKGEAFGASYDLPNESAYNETCAAIANMLWNHRLFLLKGKAKYMDIFERILYNGFLSGVSLEGDKFFYPNPLLSDGEHGFNYGSAIRAPWFNTSCCPVNVVRLMPSLPGYIYGKKDNDLYINLFINSKARLNPGGDSLLITQTTDYPWSGKVEITLNMKDDKRLTMYIRIPGWSSNEAVPSDLYNYSEKKGEGYNLHINGNPVDPQIKDGYAILERTWKDNDIIQLEFKMPVRNVLSHPNIVDNQGKVAIESGPIVYCIEGADNKGTVLNKVLRTDTTFTTRFKPGLLGGIKVVEGYGYNLNQSDAADNRINITAIPYYAWAHRGPNEMRVWIPYEE